MKPTIETKATAAGEQITPIWAAIVEAAIGRSGRTPFLMATS